MPGKTPGNPQAKLNKSAEKRLIMPFMVDVGANYDTNR
jgi:hypothetical protein